MYVLCSLFPCTLCSVVSSLFSSCHIYSTFVQRLMGLTTVLMKGSGLYFAYNSSTTSATSQYIYWQQFRCKILPQTPPSPQQQLGPQIRAIIVILTIHRLITQPRIIALRLHRQVCPNSALATRDGRTNFRSVIKSNLQKILCK